jgi:hypothetical protein
MSDVFVCCKWGNKALSKAKTKLGDIEKGKHSTLSMLGTRSWSFLIRSLILVLLTCTQFKSIWDLELISKPCLAQGTNNDQRDFTLSAMLLG